MYERDPMLSRYIKDISKYSLIDYDKEMELAKIIQESNDPQEVVKAKDELVLSNLRLVVKFAVNYHPKIKGMPDVNLSLMDLINEGNMALMRAASLFVPYKGFNFGTYAYTSIQRGIKRAVKKARFMRLPMNHYKYLAELHTLENEYSDMNQELTNDIIKEKLDITDEMLNMILQNRSPKMSLDELEETLGQDFIENRKDNIFSADQEMSKNQLKEYLYSKMKELKPMERDVIFMRFFGNQEISLKEIGDRQGLSRERIRQIVARALRTLKDKINLDSQKDNPLDEDANHGTSRQKKVITTNKKEETRNENTDKNKDGKAQDKNKENTDKKHQTHRSYESTKHLPFIQALRNRSFGE